MNRWRRALLGLAAGLALATAPVRAQSLFEELSSEIAPLSFDLAAGDGTPLFSVQTAGYEAIAAAEQTPARRSTAFGTDSGSAERAEESRERFRQTLVDDGLSAAQDRDDLTVQALNIARWTGLVLMLGGIAAVALRHFGMRSLRLPSTSQMRVVDTVRLGRQQGLHLVEIGSDRLVVAADGAGIRSVTLLPVWPEFEKRLAEESPVAGATLPDFDLVAGRRAGG